MQSNLFLTSIIDISIINIMHATLIILIVIVFCHFHYAEQVSCIKAQFTTHPKLYALKIHNKYKLLTVVPIKMVDDYCNELFSVRVRD